MAANKLIQQPDILNLDSLGAFMDAQNDPIASDMGNKEQEKVKAEEQVSPDTVSEEVISSNAQSEVPKSVQEEEHPRKPKVARSRKGKQVNVQPVIEAGSGEWDTMLRYAEFYNDNPDENRSTSAISSMRYVGLSSSATRRRSNSCKKTRAVFFDMFFLPSGDRPDTLHAQSM